MTGGHIFLVAKKELVRFISDRRLLFIAVLMPGIMVFLIYSILGSAMDRLNGTGGNQHYVIYGINVPEEIDALFRSAHLDYQPCSDEDMSEIQDSLRNKQADLLMYFPLEFSRQVTQYDLSTGLPAPNVELFFNSSSTNSVSLFSLATELLTAYESSLANKFDINAPLSGGSSYDLSTDEDTYGQILSLLMPLLLMVFMFNGCVQVAPESIAGEKERGTIATILVTPVKGSHLALGKLLALSIISFASGVSSLIGIILSLPNIIDVQLNDIAKLFSPWDYLLLLLIMFSTVLVIVSLMSVLSTYAKTVKEATAYITPFMLIILGISMSGLFLTNLSDSVNIALYLVPLLNSARCFTSIFSFDCNAVHVALSCLSNLICSILLAVALSAMFQSEKIIFSK